MQTINWGIIGCGDVTEVKSGPAFNKVPNSKLVAVMRRDAALAKDYAQRHGVPKWYDNARDLINDKDINAIYVATPPSSHLQYTLDAIDAGKPVYVEKPMALNYDEAIQIAKASNAKNVKVSVAHYRRAQPMFRKVKALVDNNVIGNIRLANLRYYRAPLDQHALAIEKNSWRVNPEISGGGLFHDIAPHPIDLACYFFGDVEKVTGIAVQQGLQYNADDIVAGTILFKNKVIFNGCWCFNAAPSATADEFEIIGSTGKICFNVFGSNRIKLVTNEGEEEFNFEPLQHVQQPMIQEVVRFFLGEGPNPNRPEAGATVMKIMDEMVGNQVAALK